MTAHRDREARQDASAGLDCPGLLDRRGPMAITVSLENKACQVFPVWKVRRDPTAETRRRASADRRASRECRASARKAGRDSPGKTACRAGRVNVV